jgi:hypothetical protein
MRDPIPSFATEGPGASQGKGEEGKVRQDPGVRGASDAVGETIERYDKDKKEKARIQNNNHDKEDVRRKPTEKTNRQE